MSEKNNYLPLPPGQLVPSGQTVKEESNTEKSKGQRAQLNFLRKIYFLEWELLEFLKWSKHTNSRISLQTFWNTPKSKSISYKTNPGSTNTQNQQLWLLSQNRLKSGTKADSHHVSSSENPVESQVLVGFNKSRCFRRCRVNVQGLPLQLTEFVQFWPLQFPHPGLLTWWEGQRRAWHEELGGAETKI